MSQNPKPPTRYKWADLYDIDSLVIPTFRYYLGRQTISGNYFAKDMVKVYRFLPYAIQTQMKSELMEEFRRDDNAIAAGTAFRPLGSDLDRKYWKLLLDEMKNS